MTSAHVYVVRHVHEHPDADDEVKLIGVYATVELARAAIARLVLLPGFDAHPEGFCVDRYELNQDHWTSGFVRWGEE